MPRPRQPTRNDVAERAGVSTAVVSYVVNDGPRPVAPDTRARVLAAIDELGYRPNHLARGLRARRSDTIGLIVPSLTIPVYAEIAAGLKQALIEDGYSILLCETEDDHEQAVRFGEVLAAKQVDGAVIVPTSDPAEIVAPLASSGTPMVFLEHDCAGVSSIVVDDHLGGYLAATHVIELGHSKVGVIRGRETVRTSSERVVGYRAALKAHRIDEIPELSRVIDDHFNLQRAEQAALDLLSSVDRPTAILGHNDYVALAVVSAAAKLGLSIPDDLTVVGYDDIQLSSFTTPPLTTVRLPKRRLGLLAGSTLRDQMVQNRAPKPLSTLAPDLVVRGSSGPAPRSSTR